ncbi:MAG: DUF29 domain-containing protein [Pseudomonadota bacterium]
MNQLTTADYETDFTIWVDEQVAILRARKFDELDLPNVVVELETIASFQMYELESRVGMLLLHLLKCQFQPERRSGNWVGTVIEQRHRIVRRLDHSPSVKRLLPEIVEVEYPVAVKRASAETGLAKEVFPAENPYTLAQLLDPDFIPGAP